ncbi:MAG TPA: COX15/CtaA family protein [Actinomycetota bacterium]|nr:COX15/CtaA family protein [Actinomycetota bacterium]
MPSFRKLSLLSLVATTVLVAVGGLVRATESGLGCGPDWPVCNGKVIPLFSHYTVAIEFSHRAIAGVVVVLLALLLVTARREHRERPRLRRAAAAAFGLVLFQAALGAVVVKLHLEAESVVLHLGTAMLLLGLLVYLYVAASAAEGQVPPADGRASGRAALAAASTFVLLLVGSWVTGREAGYVFSDWPLMDGRLIPDLALEAEALHFVHRLLAALVGVVVVVAMLPVIKGRERAPAAARLATAAVALYGVQVAVGALNIWTKFQASVAANSASVALHLALGALIWAALVGVAAVTRPQLAADVEPRRASAAGAPAEASR